MNSTEIIWNDIKKQIILKHPGDNTRQNLLSNTIEREVFDGRTKKWTRILNNTSQPSMLEAKNISRIIGCELEEILTREASMT